MIRRTVTTLAILILSAIPLLCLVDWWTPLSVGWGSPKSLPFTQIHLDGLALHIDRVTSAGQAANRRRPSPWRDYGVLRWRVTRAPIIVGTISTDGGYEDLLDDPRVAYSSVGVRVDEAGLAVNACHVGIVIAAWPIWGVAAVYLTALCLTGPFRRHRRRKKGLCIRCGYDLTGNVSGACPECGEKVEARIDTKR